MTVSDRAVIFLITSLLAAATLGTIGVLENNSVFQQKVFELRVQQIANTIDMTGLEPRSTFQKQFPEETDLRISGYGDKRLRVDRGGLDPVTVDLDSDPENVDMTDADHICVKNKVFPHFSSLRVEEGTC